MKVDKQEMWQCNVSNQAKDMSSLKIEPSFGGDTIIVITAERVKDMSST